MIPPPSRKSERTHVTRVEKLQMYFSSTANTICTNDIPNLHRQTRPDTHLNETAPELQENTIRPTKERTTVTRSTSAKSRTKPSYTAFRFLLNPDNAYNNIRKRKPETNDATRQKSQNTRAETK